MNIKIKLTKMSSRIVAYFLAVINIVGVIVCETEDILKMLPVPEDQLKSLAEDVCSFLWFDEDLKMDNCIASFSRPATNVMTPPSTLEVNCRTKDLVGFSVAPSDCHQLIALVPDDENVFIGYNILEASEETGAIRIDDAYNYTFWTTILSDDGSPTVWRRGPNLPPWIENKESFSVNIDGPQIEYNNSFTVNVVLKIGFYGEINPCSSNAAVTNFCDKKDPGDFFDTKISPKANATLRIYNQPIDDICTLIVYSGRKIVLKKKYLTSLPKRDVIGNKTSEEQVILPEIPQNVSLEAEETSKGWNIHVHWIRPKRDPLTYNLTLRAPGITRSVVVTGISTRYTFEDIMGEEIALYNVSVVAINSFGKAITSRRALFPKRSNFQAVILTGTWSVILTVAAAVVGAVLLWRRRKNSMRGPIYFPPIIKPPKECDVESCVELAVEDRWEVRSERLLLHEVIGEGAFGVVRKGTLAPGGREVAVKMLKDFPSLEEIRSFRTEMELMKSVGTHSHIVSLVGCCSGRRPLIVAEYCSRGDLLSFLRCSWDVMVSKRNAKYYNNNMESSDYRNDLFKKPKDSKLTPLVVNKLYDLQGICDCELTPLDLLSFCRQIAMGMEFLASNRVVHRDLAARNVLVTGDRTLKIADFGLSRDVYQENQYKQKGNGKMPVKWMALESLTHRIYTTQSDVWSFGVVVWEVVTVGGAPYPEVPASRLPRLLRAGYRMPRPNNCSEQLYELMMSCWRSRPHDRPTFADLHRKLDDLLNCACADEYLSLELDDEAPPSTPKPLRYVKMILRGNRVWARESYERPLKGPQSNHYTSPPAPLIKPQAV